MAMSARRVLVRTALLGLIAVSALDRGATLQAQLRSPQGYIAGTVRSSAGPEAGVWVIAETKDLPTNFIKIVVTDDAGKFAMPELPAATYRVFVRGYGLVDSTPVQLKPGAADVQLTATLAKTPLEAAKVYPGNYWLSLLEPPAASEFPGTGPDGNGIGRTMLTQNHYINSLKSDCNFCHQLGNAETRDIRACPQGEARAEDARGRVGVAARHGRPRDFDVLGADEAGKRTAIEDVRRGGQSGSRKARCRPHRRGRRASSGISS